MTVSVIMPIYNAAHYLRESIDSVINQTFTAWELILVDDCSSDGSREIEELYAKRDQRIKLLNQSCNAGVAVARNAAIKQARGRFIAFIDSDDVWYPDKLEVQIKFMITKGSAASFTAYEKITDNGTIIMNVGVPERVNYYDLLKTCVIGCSTVVYDTKQIGKIYMSVNTPREDFATWLRMLKITEYAYGCQRILGKYRIRERQRSANKIKMAFANWDLYRRVERLPLIPAIYYFCHYGARGILRTYSPRLALRLGVLDRALSRDIGRVAGDHEVTR